MKQPDKPRATKRAAKPKADPKATIGKRGRPPYAWTPEIEDEIFKRIARGEAVAKICNDDWLPSEDTFYRRLASDDVSFRERYTHAREVQGDRIFEECLAIADDTTGDFIQTPDGPVFDREAVQRAKLRIDTRKWMAGKLRPKVYGDKLDLTHANPDGTPISKIEVEFVNGPKISDG